MPTSMIAHKALQYYMVSQPRQFRSYIWSCGCELLGWIAVRAGRMLPIPTYSPRYSQRTCGVNKVLQTREGSVPSKKRTPYVLPMMPNERRSACHDILSAARLFAYPIIPSSSSHFWGTLLFWDKQEHCCFGPEMEYAMSCVGAAVSWTPGKGKTSLRLTENRDYEQVPRPTD